MTRVLVTGGRGGLGRELLPRLQRAGHSVRVMSRAPGSVSLGSVGAPLEWAQADLAAGAGLEAAWGARIRRRRVLLVAVPLPGVAAAGFRAGLNTCPGQAHGRVTWEEYLSR